MFYHFSFFALRENMDFSMHSWHFCGAYQTCFFFFPCTTYHSKQKARTWCKQNNDCCMMKYWNLTWYFYNSMAEWLRWLIRNQLGLSRAGSSPVTVVSVVDTSHYLLIRGTNTCYGENLPVVSSRWGEKSITSSEVVVISSMYATFRKSMKNYNRGPTNHISSRSKLQQITACHVEI